MVTCTLDARKLPRPCVGERCKRFQAKTWGRRGGGGHTEFSRERRQVFPMQSVCSGGVGQCLRSVRLLGASIFFFWGWSLLDRGRKKKPAGADDDTVICSTFSFRITGCFFRII